MDKFEQYKKLFSNVFDKSVGCRFFAGCYFSRVNPAFHILIREFLKNIPESDNEPGPEVLRYVCKSLIVFPDSPMRERAANFFIENSFPDENTEDFSCLSDIDINKIGETFLALEEFYFYLWICYKDFKLIVKEMLRIFREGKEPSRWSSFNQIILNTGGHGAGKNIVWEIATQLLLLEGKIDEYEKLTRLNLVNNHLQTRQRKKGGIESGKSRKSENFERNQRIITKSQILIKDGKKRDCVSILAKIFSLSERQIRNILSENGILTK